MIKTMIVEDEVLARLGLHQLVDWTSLGFDLLDDACDGEEALRRIESERPQLILLDINLPKVNGLQIQKYIVSHFPDCCIIVISCNEDFSVVKEAMRTGAFDFLRKLNLTSDELTRVLTKCRIHIERSSAFHFSSQPAVIMQYEDLVSPNSVRLFNNQTFCGMICVACPGLPASELPRIAQSAADCLFSNGVTCHLFLRAGQCFYLLIKSIPDGFDVASWRIQVDECADASLYAGVCFLPVENRKGLIQATALCEQILLPAYYGKVKMLEIYTERIQRCDHLPESFSSMQLHLRTALRVVDKEKITQTIHTMFDALNQHEMIGIPVLKRVFMDVLSYYSAAAQEIGGSIEEIELNASNTHYQTVMALDSLQAVLDWFILFSDQFVRQYYVSYKASRSDILRKALVYIEENIRSSIQLCTAARQINVSETYLSSLFKKEIGYNFITYVHIRKIEEAKKLFRQGKLVKDVSDALGYENSTYFSKVFKRCIGITPDAWRKNALDHSLED